MVAKLEPTYAWALIAVGAIAVIGLALSFQAALFAVLFGLVGWWTWRNPEEGFLLFLVLMPILPMLKITQTIGTVTLVKDVIIAVLFLSLFLIPLLMKRLPYRRSILFTPILALVAWTAFETLRAESLILGILRARDIGLYILLYFGVLYLPHDDERMRRRVKWFTVGVLVTLGLAVYQWFFAVDSAVLRFDPAREIWIPRISSILAHPSIYGEYLITAAALFGSLVLFVKRNSWRLLFAVLGLLTLPAIILTYSRAVWLGLVAAGAAMGVVWIIWLAARRWSMRRLVSTGAGLALIGIVVLSGLSAFTPVGVFIRTAVDPTYGSNVERLEFLARLVAPLSNIEALFGKGLGEVTTQNFREVDLQTVDIVEGDARAVQLTKNRTLVDNQYLKTFVEMGLAGLLIYVWLFWRFLKGAFASRGAIGLFGVGCLAAFVLQGLFIDIWDIFPTNAMFWIVGGLVSASLTPLVKSHV